MPTNKFICSRNKYTTIKRKSNSRNSPSFPCLHPAQLLSNFCSPFLRQILWNPCSQHSARRDLRSNRSPLNQRWSINFLIYSLCGESGVPCDFYPSFYYSILIISFCYKIFNLIFSPSIQTRIIKYEKVRTYPNKIFSPFSKIGFPLFEHNFKYNSFEYFNNISFLAQLT